MVTIAMVENSESLSVFEITRRYFFASCRHKTTVTCYMYMLQITFNCMDDHRLYLVVLPLDAALYVADISLYYTIFPLWEVLQ